MKKNRKKEKVLFNFKFGKFANFTSVIICRISALDSIFKTYVQS